MASGFRRYFAWGIYLDDTTGGVKISGNVVARAVRGLVHLHNGRDNLIENNIFVGGDLQQVEYGGWTESSEVWKRYLPAMAKGYESVAGQPAWRRCATWTFTPARPCCPTG